jgi:hypothetical protein
MNELFFLDKNVDLHNGTELYEHQTMRVVKPTGTTIEGEMPEVISISIALRDTKFSKDIRSQRTFELTTEETERLIVALQGAIKKEKKPSPPYNLLGKKLRPTLKGEGVLTTLGMPDSKKWSVYRVDQVGRYMMYSSPNGYKIVRSYKELFGEDPDFEIVEGPATPLQEKWDATCQPAPNSSTVLDKAKDLIFGDRVNDYGKTSDSFKNICVGWKIIFEPGFTPERVGLAMAWLKICRASNDNCEKEDSIIDLAGYAACIEKIKKDL